MFARPGDGRRPRLPLPCGRRKAGACAVRLAGKTQERGGPATVRSTLRAGRHAGVHLRVRRAAGHHFCGTHRADPPDLWKAAGLLRRLTRRACGRCLTGALRNARLWIARPGRGWPESASARSGGSGRAPAQVRSIRLRFAALAGCALAGSGVEIVRARGSVAVFSPRKRFQRRMAAPCDTAHCVRRAAARAHDPPQFMASAGGQARFSFCSRLRRWSREVWAAGIDPA